MTLLRQMNAALVNYLHDVFNQLIDVYNTAVDAIYLKEQMPYISHFTNIIFLHQLFYKAHKATSRIMVDDSLENRKRVYDVAKSIMLWCRVYSEEFPKTIEYQECDECIKKSATVKVTECFKNCSNAAEMIINAITDWDKHPVVTNKKATI